MSHLMEGWLICTSPITSTFRTLGGSSFSCCGPVTVGGGIICAPFCAGEDWFILEAHHITQLAFPSAVEAQSRWAVASTGQKERVDHPGLLTLKRLTRPGPRKQHKAAVRLWKGRCALRRRCSSFTTRAAGFTDELRLRLPRNSPFPLE